MDPVQVCWSRALQQYVELKTVECIDVWVYTYRAWVWGRHVLFVTAVSRTEE